jgi:hypothetical protein
LPLLSGSFVVAKESSCRKMQGILTLCAGKAPFFRFHESLRCRIFAPSNK